MLIAVEGQSSGDTLRMPSVGPTNESAPPPTQEAKEEQGQRSADSLTEEEIVACVGGQGGNVRRAAGVLGVGRSALYRRMKKLKIKG